LKKITLKEQLQSIKQQKSKSNNFNYQPLDNKFSRKYQRRV